MVPRRGHYKVLPSPNQVPRGLLPHARNRDRDDLTHVQQPSQMPGVALIGLDPTPHGRCNFDGASTRQPNPSPVKNRANPNPVGPAS